MLRTTGLGNGMLQDIKNKINLNNNQATYLIAKHALS